MPLRVRAPLIAPTAAPANVITWINVGGTWKQATVWINVDGAWRAATVSLNVLGAWK